MKVVVVVVGISEVYNIIFLFGEGFDFVEVVVLVAHQIFVLLDVVVHVPQSHLRLHSLFLYLHGVTQQPLLVKLFLDAGQ